MTISFTLHTFLLYIPLFTISFFFFLNDPAPPDIYPLPLHDPLPILSHLLAGSGLRPRFIHARRATLEPAPAERRDGSRRTGPLRVQGDTAHGNAPGSGASQYVPARSEEHTSELQSQSNLVCRLLLEK